MLDKFKLFTLKPKENQDTREACNSEHSAKIEELQNIVDFQNTIIGKIFDEAEKGHRELEGMQKQFEQVFEVATEMSESAESQSLEAGNSTIAMVELAYKINDVSENIKGVNDITGLTKEVCYGTGETVRSFLAKAAESTVMAGKIMDKMQLLNARTHEIIKIVKIIKSINEQINILSFNAAIEAARAGEAGRGFSVVSEEIRKLADQTKSSTKYIEEIVKSVQQESDETHRLVTDTKHKFTEQRELVQDTGSAIDKIVEHMEEIVTKLDTVNDSIENINEYKDKATISISTITASLMETSDSTDHLVTQCNEFIHAFKIAEENLGNVERLTKENKDPSGEVYIKTSGKEEEHYEYCAGWRT